MLLVQFIDDAEQRRVGVLEQSAKEMTLRAVPGYASTYALAQAAIRQQCSLEALITSAFASADAALASATHSGACEFDYATLASQNKILTPLDHPDTAHCLVTGTGLTHLGSADSRNAMHSKIAGAMDELTDSMKMFRMGVEGGKPAPGQTGVQPEWFYKGDGSIVCANGQPLTMPDFSLDGGEEPEVAGLYVIGDDQQPYRVGFAIGNEFSDHVTERQNYLYLAHSKLRACALSSALLVGDLPLHVEGFSRILDRNQSVRWEKPFVSGENNMSHTIANLEYHHFKYPLFNRAGDVHIHFFGTATLSVADAISVQPGETFEIDVPLFGPPLRNRLAVQSLAQPVVTPL